MNDFTKEELEELMHCVYSYRDLCDENVEDSLCDKLKSMIDNYCEHEFIATLDLKDWSKREAYAIPMCRKCRRSPEVIK